jgi:hypothetical protein
MKWTSLLLIAGLGACGWSSATIAATPTVAAEHAALQRHSVAKQAATASRSERKRLGTQSVAAQSPAHRKLSAQDVAGQRGERKAIAKEHTTFAKGHATLAKQSVASHAPPIKTPGLSSKR